MRLLLAAVGRLKAGPERALVERYVERIGSAGRAIGISALDIKEIPESAKARPADRIAEEAKALLGLVPPDADLVALDPRGRSLTSEQFAAALAAARGGRRPVFAIGGADGLAEPVRARAKLLVSFGSLTLPHQLVRILLVEQIYRAVTILARHPYHRG